MKAFYWRLGALALFGGLLAGAYYRHSLDATTEAANAFLASLSEEQRAKATFGFEDDERFFWQFIPADDIPKRYNRPRKGLPLTEMAPHQKHLAHALLAAGLSQSGYMKAVTVMSLEQVLKELEKDTVGRRDAEKYFFSVFGKPSKAGTWGYRVEGHHVSLHFTMTNGKIVAAPTFFGANPAEVRVGPRAGLRALAREEDLARELLASLSAEQKKTAIVSPKAYPDILTAADRKAALENQPSGLKASSLKPGQSKLLANVIDEYIVNLPPDIAAKRREQVTRAGANLFFAWAGVEERGGPHYYRVHAPGVFLIEYDNTQNGANHIHAVWRDFQGDWGQDVLKAHYQASHGGATAE
ncbi:MAG: DUF3500 domain-containing protein [Bryobacteraceae bacterium]|nr:DUF3500 domain-containing protein [Bryobacteraceae bacterium]